MGSQCSICRGWGYKPPSGDSQPLHTTGLVKKSQKSPFWFYHNSSTAPTNSTLLHSCPGFATYWRKSKCCVTYLLTVGSLILILNHIKLAVIYTTVITTKTNQLVNPVVYLRNCLHRCLADTTFDCCLWYRWCSSDVKQGSVAPSSSTPDPDFSITFNSISSSDEAAMVSKTSTNFTQIYQKFSNQIELNWWCYVMSVCQSGEFLYNRRGSWWGRLACVLLHPLQTGDDCSVHGHTAAHHFISDAHGFPVVV